MDLGIDEIGPATLIGAGGSSAVYSATRANVGDIVAVKLLHQGLVDTNARDFFSREAEALRRLGDEPGIVAILDSGVNDRGQPYLMMPYLESGSAQDRLTRDGVMGWAQAASVVAQAADAVARGHRLGIWHRDLKPANLLLTEHDTVFVADFGISKILHSTQSTSVGISATPAYAAPEALDGQYEEASDTYSLAATFHALITGAPPFESGSDVDAPSDGLWATIQRIHTEPPPPLTGHGVPAAVDRLIARALNKNPQERPSALELGSELTLLVERGGLPDVRSDRGLPDARSMTGLDQAKPSSPHTTSGLESASLEEPTIVAPSTSRNRVALVMALVAALSGLLIYLAVSNNPESVAANSERGIGTQGEGGNDFPSKDLSSEDSEDATETQDEEVASAPAQAGDDDQAAGEGSSETGEAGENQQAGDESNAPKDDEVLGQEVERGDAADEEMDEEESTQPVEDDQEPLVCLRGSLVDDACQVPAAAERQLSCQEAGLVETQSGCATAASAQFVCLAGTSRSVTQAGRCERQVPPDIPLSCSTGFRLTADSKNCFSEAQVSTGGTSCLRGVLSTDLAYCIIPAIFQCTPGSSEYVVGSVHECYVYSDLEARCPAGTSRDGAQCLTAVEPDTVPGPFCERGELSDDEQTCLLGPPVAQPTVADLPALFFAEPIQFTVGSATILPESTTVLDRAADLLRAMPSSTRVEIQGHTDSTGDDELNLALSESRAQSVLNYLVANGVEESYLVAVGYGSSSPLVSPEVTPEDRQLNRRIEWVDLDG